MDNSSPPSYQDVKKQYPTAPAPNNQPMQHNQPMPSYGFQQPHQMPQPQFEQQYYPQSGGQVNFPLQQAGPNTTVIVTGPTNYGPHPQHVVCPSCGERIETKLISDNNYTTHMIALVLCIMGCFLCSCIPYFMDSCKNQNHYCPQCNAYLGTYSSATRGNRW